MLNPNIPWGPGAPPPQAGAPTVQAGNHQPAPPNPPPQPGVPQPPQPPQQPAPPPAQQPNQQPQQVPGYIPVPPGVLRSYRDLFNNDAVDPYRKSITTRNRTLHQTGSNQCRFKSCTTSSAQP